MKNLVVLPVLFGIVACAPQMSLSQAEAAMEANAQDALRRGDVFTYQFIEQERQQLPADLRKVDQEFDQEQAQQQRQDQMDGFQRQLDEHRQEIDLLRGHE
jgi:hypothetical protein